ncbi:recombinase family protein [Brevibacillus laterosporus]
MTATTIPVAIYARVSTDRQGDSIEHQVSFLREYVSRNLGELYYTDDTLIYSDEGISGYSTTILDRPAMKQLLDDAKKGVFKVVLIKGIGREKEHCLEKLYTFIFTKPYLCRLTGIWKEKGADSTYV